MPQDEKPVFATRHLDSTASARALARRDGTAPLDPGLPWVVEFRVVGSAVTIQLRLKDVMVMGRADPERNMFPEIDLSPFDALAKGVSRRHAVILVRNGRVTVKDLDSTNGTQLNNFELIKETEYRLRHGDELALGQLHLQVLFNIVPASQDNDSLVLNQALNIPKIGKGQNILIVADDADVSAVFQLSLTRAGFNVTTARLADSALRELTEHKPEMVILDMALPDATALEHVRFIRKHVSRSVPVVVTSGATAGYHMGKALEAGADVVLGKPVSVEELLSAIEKVITQPDEKP
jgi:CheY-like chemotaxis protein